MWAHAFFLCLYNSLNDSRGSIIGATFHGKGDDSLEKVKWKFAKGISKKLVS
jgi:hypothetical protein